MSPTWPHTSVHMKHQLLVLHTLLFHYCTMLLRIQYSHQLLHTYNIFQLLLGTSNIVTSTCYSPSQVLWCGSTNKSYSTSHIVIVVNRHLLCTLFDSRKHHSVLPVRALPSASYNITQSSLSLHYLRFKCTVSSIICHMYTDSNHCRIVHC